MPSSLQFVILSSIEDMRSTETKTQVRKFVMKDIGKARRRRKQSPRPKQIALALRENPLPPKPNPSPEQSNTTSTTPLPNHNPQTSHHILPQALYNPYIRILPHTADPFNTTAVPLDPIATGLLRYFIFYSTHFPQNFTFTPDITGVVRAALSDELTATCILSAAASRMLYMPGATPRGCEERALVCTQRCLGLLRGRLMDEARGFCAAAKVGHDVDLQVRVVDCVLYLAAAALYRGDEASAETHTRAAWRLVERCGGVAALRPHGRVLVRLLALDDVLASVALRPCGCLCTSYDPGPLATLHLDGVGGVVAVGECTAFRLLGKGEEALPEDLRVLVGQIVECDRVRGVGLGDGRGVVSSVRAAEVRQWCVLRSLSIRNRLLDFVAADDRTNALKIALIVWTLLPPSDARQANAAQRLTSQLNRALEESPRSTWKGNEDVRLWCLIVGFFASPSVRHDVCRWVLSEIADAIQHAAETTLLRACSADLCEDLLAFQRGFLFRTPTSQILTKKLVDLLALDTVQACTALS